MTLFSITAAIVIIEARADTPNDPIIEPEAAKIETIERPQGTYQIGDVIRYRIRVYWPHVGNQIRISPPELELENLELMGVGQETVSDQNESLPSKPTEQILTFRFTAKKPGSASIKRFFLRWNEGEGAATSTLSIPPAEFTIKGRPKTLPLLITLIGTLSGGFAIFVFLTLLQKKRNCKTLDVHKSLEEITLEELQETRTRWQSQKSDQEFLSGLIQVLKGYASQKLDWNPSQDSYNDLQEKANVKWSKKEASELNNFFDILERERFSGVAIERQKLFELFQSLYSFVERKKTL